METDVKQDYVEPSSTDSESTLPEGQLQESQETDEARGLREALEAERQKRQEAEQRAMFNEQMLHTMQSQPAPQAQEEVDPYDYATNESVQKLVQKAVQDATKQSNAIAQQQNIQRVRDKHKDYDEVINVHFNKIQQSKPGLLKTINDLPDAAEIAYMIGQSSSEYQKKKIEKATKEIADRMSSNSNKTNTLSGIGGSDTSGDETDKYATMSDADIDAEIRKVTKRQ